jgi:hypothetical protein
MSDYASPQRPQSIASRRRSGTVGAQTRSRGAPLQPGHYVVLVGFAAMITIRFFTEALHALPRAANFIDVPLLLVFATAAICSRQQGMRPVQRSTVFTISVLFILLTTASTLVNFDRIDVFPVLTFVYGFLSPAAFYLTTYVLWTPGRASAMSRLLIALAAIQFITIVVFDVPEFLQSRNPDVVSGTFGTNAYQLVFFLILFIALVIGLVTFEPRRWITVFALPFIAAAFLAIFLAQYRSLLLTTGLAMLFIGALVAQKARGLFIGIASAGGLLVTLMFIVVYVPTNRFTQAFDALQNDKSYFIESRLKPADDVYRLYGDNWHYPVLGTGPGTYSSRAWLTFANISETPGQADVAAPYARRLMGGQPYETDVSKKYVVPRLDAPAKYGTYQFSSPYSSYLALAAEVGLVAAALLVALYFIVFWRLVRATLHLARTAKRGDPLPALALAAATAFFVLVQMAVLGNWFETARVTVPAWILLAVVTRELTSREDFRDFPY